MNKSPRRKTPQRKTSRRKSQKSKSPRHKSQKSKSSRRKSQRSKSPRRKSQKSKSPYKSQKSKSPYKSQKSKSPRHISPRLLHLLNQLSYTKKQVDIENKPKVNNYYIILSNLFKDASKTSTAVTNTSEKAPRNIISKSEEIKKEFDKKEMTSDIFYDTGNQTLIDPFKVSVEKSV